MIEIKPGGAGYADGIFNGFLDVFEDGKHKGRVTGDFDMTEAQAGIFKSYCDGFLLGHALTFQNREQASKFLRDFAEHGFKLGDEANKAKKK